ncbi:PIR Superfamily Protein [Plasmodium ovale curtisi]|uniref:PIR Superfamily Protein n=1 Tax=Plasmodium ovale curtisi TaxID=864141 RepID=A0A1A8X5K3_PLAOA|nr:PIR Superfamily Protein [Plasmodium ovale curtisi]
MEKAETILENLTKYKLYIELDKKEYNSRKCSYCNIVNSLIPKYKGIYELCCIFVRNLTELPKILKDEEDNNERCSYLNFWITDHIRKKFDIDWNDSKNIHTILRRFLSVENFIPSASKNNCRFYYNSNINLELWKKLKDLYDYIKNYNYIERKINSQEYSCEKHSHYFDYITSLYKTFKEECCNESLEKCSYPFYFDDLCKKTKYLTQINCDKEKELAGVHQVPRGSEVSGNQRETTAISSQSDSLQVFDHIAQSSSEYNNPDYYVKLSLGISSLGIFFIIIFLYKFTTLGTWIRYYLLKKKKN